MVKLDVFFLVLTSVSAVLGFTEILPTLVDLSKLVFSFSLIFFIVSVLLTDELFQKDKGILNKSS